VTPGKLKEHLKELLLALLAVAGATSRFISRLAEPSGAHHGHDDSTEEQEHPPDPISGLDASNFTVLARAFMRGATQLLGEALPGCQLDGEMEPR
jgi:hypothetical protein